MVTKDVSNLMRESVQGNMRTLDSIEEIRSYLDNLMIMVESITGKDDYYEKIYDELFKFINKVRCTVQARLPYRKLIEYHDSLHRRSEELTVCIKNILASMESLEYKQVVMMGDEGCESLYSASGHVLWSRIEFNPKIIRKLISVLIYASKSRTSNTVYCEVLRVVSSVGSIYKDIDAGYGQDSVHNKVEMLNAIERYTKHKFTDSDRFTERAMKIPGSIEAGLIRFITDLNHGRPDDKLYNSLTNDIRRSFKLTRDRNISEYNMAKDSNYSFKSSGVKVDRTNIPALYSSIIEKDLLKNDPVIMKFDQIVNFKIEYPALQVKGKLRQVPRMAVSIPQKKLALRTIFITNNHVQDRLGWYHNILSDVLHNISCDATFDQFGRGIQFANKISSITNKAIYCLDLSKATDTMLLIAQRYVIRTLLLPKYGKDDANALAEAWESLISDENIAVVNNKTIKFKLKDGQPQGYLSSFTAFALLHHICVLYTYYLYLQDTQEPINPRQYYRVLGDDSIMMTPDNDKNQIFKNLYIAVMKAVNVECNPEKGFINSGERRSSLTEFAKVTSINGTYFTNTPFNICASSANKSIEAYVKYLDWLGKYTSINLNEEFIMQKISKKFKTTTNQETAIRTLMHNRCDGLELYNLVNPNKNDQELNDLEKFVNWFNFIKTVKTSYYKYILTHSEAERTIGIENFLSPESVIREKLKLLDNIIDLSIIEKLDIENVKLGQEALTDVLSESMISVMKQLGENDLVDLINHYPQINIGYTNSLLAKLDNYNLTLVDMEMLIETHPLELTSSDFNKMMMLKKPMGFRSWSLDNAQIDKSYFETLGNLINSNWAKRVESIVFGYHDQETIMWEDNNVNYLTVEEEDQLIESLQLDFDLDFDFDI